MKKKIRLALITFVLLIFCTTSVTAQAATYSLSQTKATVNVGNMLDLDVLGTDIQPSWTSYNVNIAKVNDKGEVTAVRKGSTTISARIGLDRKKCSITVVEPTIKLDKSTVNLYAGGTSSKTAKLKATIKGASKSVVWKSSNEAVATVDETGMITAISEGKAIITALANGKSADCIITVKESSITLNMDTMQLSTKGTGSSMKLTANVVGSSKTVKWSSSDKTIATVSGGKVTGKKTGTATITATANGVSASCTVNVIKDSISINEEKVLLYAEETKQLKTNAGRNDVVIWSTTADSVAAVDEKGVITAVGKGTATISAECNGTTDSCEVTVKKTDTIIDEGIVLLKTKGDNKTYALNYSVVGRKNSIKWTSSDKNIATVSGGKITAKKAGTVTITATANGVSDSVEVTVKEFDPTITLNQSEYVLYTVKGNTVTLKATVDGSSKTVTWASSDTAVATVNKGKVTALKEGTALITATANGVTAECLITVKESKVVLETENLWLKKGETDELTVDVIGSSQTVKYATANKKVATVKNGVITAKGLGEADIKVTANGITSICHVIVSDCEHSYEGVVTKEATCKEVGIKEFTCINCGNSYSETIAKTGHSFILAETVPATCMNSGINKYACVNCSATKQELMEATGHSFSEWQLVKEATEFVEGIEKQVCENCGTEETRKTAKKAHQHMYNEAVIEPTCTEQGYTKFTCECGDSYVDNYIDATGHDWGEWAVLKEATETEEGEKIRICKTCNVDEYKVIPVIKHEHDYKEEVVEPTCENMGYTIFTCECGNSYIDNYVDALEHNYVDTETQKATCLEQGIITHTCKECGYCYTENIGYGECNYEDVITEPTCTNKGYTTPTCSECGAVKARHSEVAALGHCPDEGTLTKEATCQQEGIMTYNCSRCKKSYTESLGYGDHKYVDTIVKATCVLPGYTNHKCSVCGKSFNDTYTDILKHDMDNGEVTKEATCSEDGEKTFTCKRCKYSYKNTYTDPNNHNFVEKVVDPTCTEEGYTEHWCSRCEYTHWKTDYVDALGHEKDEVISVVEASKAGKGYTEYSCTRCDGTFHDDFTYYQPSVEQILAEIEEIKKEYPDGTLWDRDTKYTTIHGALTGGCVAFVEMVNDAVFGFGATPRIEHSDYSKIRVGDVIRFTHSEGEHEIMVIGVEDDYLIAAEGNARDSDGIGRVRYNSIYTKEFFDTQTIIVWTHFTD